jgi:protocadherin-16/23
VREDVPVGFVVGNVVSSEGSEESLGSGRARGGHVMYTLTSVSPSDTDTAFDMDRSSGSLVVARRLDRETFPEYRLEVRALDTSTTNNPQSSAVVVRVEISDVNDNTPRWEKELITVEIPEDAAVGSAVWNFSASDADAGSNGELRYGLVSCSPWGRDEPPFSVDPLTGSLTLLSPLDYETLSEYTVVVRVTDQAPDISDRLSATLTARIKLKDVNDNPPVFVSPSSQTAHVRNGAGPGTRVARLLAVDPDSGDNGKVSYVISGGDPEGRFSLGYENGVLSLARPLEPSARYFVNVTASDRAASPRRSTFGLLVLVQGSAESPLKFVSSEYHANVSEDASVGAFVLTVQAKSGDGEYFFPIYS